MSGLAVVVVVALSSAGVERAGLVCVPQADTASAGGCGAAAIHPGRVQPVHALRTRPEVTDLRRRRQGPSSASGEVLHPSAPAAVPSAPAPSVCHPPPDERTRCG